MKLVFFPEYLELECIIRMLLAGVCGILLGAERSKNQKVAGIRTYVIVAVCASIFAMVSTYGFLDVASDKTQVDISRVAHTVVTGVSFLGTGIIFSKRDQVQGITTAAGIWVTAAIGLACGMGMYFLAGIASVLILATQIVIKKVTFRGSKVKGKIVAYMNDDIETLRNFEKILQERHIEICGTNIRRHKNQQVIYTFYVRVYEKDNIAKQMCEIITREEVKNVEF